MIVVSLPFPPPTNNLFPTRGGKRVPSPRYRTWRDEARIDLLSQRPARLAGGFHAELRFDRPDRRARDLDNYAKAPLDSLVTAGVIEDDHLARKLTLEWLTDEPVTPARVHITITAAVRP